ncbi:MAG: ribosome maturation factor RimM, partial [Dissulfurimicrobium sp.]
MEVDLSQVVAVGKITKAHGNKGEVQVYPYVRDKGIFFDQKIFLIRG